MMKWMKTMSGNLINLALASGVSKVDAATLLTMAQPNIDPDRMNPDQMQGIAAQVGVTLLSADPKELKLEFSRKVLQHSLNITTPLKDWVILAGIAGESEKIIHTCASSEECDEFIGDLYDDLEEGGFTFTTSA